MHCVANILYGVTYFTDKDPMLRISLWMTLFYWLCISLEFTTP